jgi:hypothetical protein
VRCAQASLCVLALGVFLDCKASDTKAQGEAGAAAATATTTPDAEAPNATPIPTASVQAMVNPRSLPAYSGPTGSVEGRIRVKGPAAPRVDGLDFSRCTEAEGSYGRLFREGADLGNGTRALADAVVAVTGYSGYFVAEKSESKSLVFDKCTLGARTVTLTFGQRLDVTSTSKDLFAPALEQQTGLALMAVGQGMPAIKLYPPRAGHFSLVDRLQHKYLFVDVYAFLHPLHTVSNLEGRYRIDGVPVGKLTVNATHPAFRGEVHAEVDIKPSVVHTVDLELEYKVPAPPPAPSTSVSRRGTLNY